MEKTKIIVEQIRVSPLRRFYHTKVELSQDREVTFDRPLRDTSEKHLKAIGETGRQLVESLMKTAGVAQVNILPYTLRVDIGRAFDWDKDGINTSVLDMLKAIYAREGGFGEDQIEVEMEPSPVPLRQPEDIDPGVDA